MDIKRTLEQKKVEITTGDLPWHCPPDDAPLWCMHPQVFLPVEALGEAICPYCSTHYVLKNKPQ
jgi:uncharacterized Zn-finger protein